jgi:hypothetical protein
MAKWHGVIGFSVTVERVPGVWTNDINERTYYGDLIRNSRRLQSTSQLNDDITISNSISIIADPYAKDNFHAMRYAEFMGTKWKISDIQVEYPRLILTLGGVYNGEQA